MVNIYRPTWIHKSPRIVPGFEFLGSVAPRRTRPVLTASSPSQTYNYYSHYQIHKKNSNINIL